MPKIQFTTNIPVELRTAEGFLQIKKRYADAGITVWNIGNTSVHNMPEVTLNLPGRDQKIEEYKQYLRNLGKAGITYTTYAHMGNGIWTSGRAMIRGASAREFDQNSPDARGNWDGKVFAGPLSIYGNAVVVDHGLGLQTLYGHLSSIAVKEGDPIIKEQELGQHIETPLKRCAVHNQDNHVRMFVDHELPGYPFLLGKGGQAVRARQVHEVHFHIAGQMHAFFLLHRLPGPVPRVLAKSGQRIEHRALPGVGITRQGHHEVPVVHCDAELEQICNVVDRAGRASRGCRPHGRSGHFFITFLHATVRSGLVASRGRGGGSWEALDTNEVGLLCP